MSGKIGVYFDQQNIGGGLDLTALAEQTSQKWGGLVPVVKVVPVLALAVSEIKADIEAQELDGVLLTMFDGRTNLALQVAEEVKHYFPGKVYATVIPRNVRLSEAPSHGKPITAYDKTCRGADAATGSRTPTVTASGSTLPTW